MAKDYKDTDYECYLLGCRSAGIEPVGLWRFRLLQEAYLHHAAEAEQDAQGGQVPLFVLDGLAALVAEGYKIAAGGNAEGDEPGAAACGVREPRVPLEPVLVGCAARTADAGRPRRGVLADMNPPRRKRRPSRNGWAKRVR